MEYKKWRMRGKRILRCICTGMGGISSILMNNTMTLFIKEININETINFYFINFIKFEAQFETCSHFLLLVDILNYMISYTNHNLHHLLYRLLGQVLLDFLLWIFQLWVRTVCLFFYFWNGFGHYCWCIGKEQ